MQEGQDETILVVLRRQAYFKRMVLDQLSEKGEKIGD